MLLYFEASSKFIKEYGFVPKLLPKIDKESLNEEEQKIEVNKTVTREREYLERKLNSLERKAQVLPVSFAFAKIFMFPNCGINLETYFFYVFQITGLARKRAWYLRCATARFLVPALWGSFGLEIWKVRYGVLLEKIGRAGNRRIRLGSFATEPLTAL